MGVERRDYHITDIANADVRYVVNPEVIDCPLQDGRALLDTGSGTYFSLNGSGAMIWQHAHQPVSFQDLRNLLAAHFSHHGGNIDRDLRTLLADLLDAGLFRTVQPSPSVS